MKKKILSTEESTNSEKKENHNHRAHSFASRQYDHKNGNKNSSSFKILIDKWETYKPLLIIFIFCLILSWVQNTREAYPLEQIMHSFMGYFFIFLSLFKFFDLKGFVDGFATYDLITDKLRLYGYLYPFIEFFLGLAYLTKFELFFINWVTVIVMTVSGIGVLISVFSGKDIKCACLGSVLNLPLGTISIVENFGMGAMAAYSLYQ